MVEGVGRAAGEPDGNIFLPRALFDLAVLSEENNRRFVFGFGGKSCSFVSLPVVLELESLALD